MHTPTSILSVACVLFVACSGSSADVANVPDAEIDGALDATIDGAPDAAFDAAEADSPSCESGPERNGPYSALAISGNTAAKGAIDPSVVYPAGADMGWMTYTAVPDEAHDTIAIASSSNAGATWQYLGDVAVPSPISVSTDDMSLCGSTSCPGTLIHESSSLVVDTADPDPNRRLKVFVHSYFFHNDRHLELGYLALYTAAAPEGPWSETRLFGWDSASPLSSDGVVYNVRSDPALPELHDCYIVGEPGGLYREPGILDLSLSCVRVAAGGATIDVELLRSADHGQSWSYVGMLLGADDAAALGSSVAQVNGSALMHANGRYYVIVSPTGTVEFPGGTGEGYRGCVVVPIADIETGSVERCGGAPVTAAAFLGQPGQFVGACAADEGASSIGMMIPVPDFSDPVSVQYRLYGAGAPLL